MTPRVHNRITRLLLTALTVMLVQGLGLARAEVYLTPEGIADKVRAYILETTPFDEPDAKLYVEMVKLPYEAVRLQGSELNVTLSDHRSTPMTFRTIVQVVMTTEKETRQIGVPVHIMVEKPVWVTTRFIGAREDIPAAGVVKQRRKLDYEAVYALGTNIPVANLTSRLNLQPGTVLSSRNVKQTPAVYRNDDIRLMLTMTNGVQVAVFGKALEDGALGERIRVTRKTPDNKTKYYTGKVINRNTVAISM